MHTPNFERIALSSRWFSTQISSGPKSRWRSACPPAPACSRAAGQTQAGRSSRTSGSPGSTCLAQKAVSESPLLSPPFLPSPRKSAESKLNAWCGELYSSTHFLFLNRIHPVCIFTCRTHPNNWAHRRWFRNSGGNWTTPPGKFKDEGYLTLGMGRSSTRPCRPTTRRTVSWISWSPEGRSLLL